MKGKITLIQILLVFTVIICGFLWITDYLEHRGSKSGFEDIKQSVTLPTPQTAATAEPTIPPREPDGMLSKYAPLYQRNNDTVGWVRIEGTGIDYPVMQTKNTNAYYLHRDFDRNNSPSGTPFMDYQCDSKILSDNTIIYSHNMKNGTMFHDLLKYADKAFYDAHKFIDFDTLYDTGRYEIFAVSRMNERQYNEFKYYEFVNAKDKVGYDAFVEGCIKRSLYDTAIVPNHPEKLLTLSTCSYSSDNERFVVFARKIN